MRKNLADPAPTLKPKEEWPARFQRAKSLVQTPDDLYLIAHGLWRRRMLRQVATSELIRDIYGQILAGAFFQN